MYLDELEELFNHNIRFVLDISLILYQFINVNDFKKPNTVY